MKNIITLILLLNIFLTPIYAKKKYTEYKLKNILGIAVGGESLEQVKQKAINNAKINALKTAGIEENISSYTNYFRSETEKSMAELFTSDILSNINGIVKNIDIISSEEGFTAEHQIKYTVRINCTVVKYHTTKDLEFNAWIKNVQNVYKIGEGLSFTIKPTLDCYVRAFIFSNESYILLPNDYEKSKVLKAFTEYNFPDPSLIESYEMTIDDKSKNRETDRLIIVLLKKDIFYTEDVNYKNIIDWIMSIPPDERLIKSFSFEIFK